ncbi:MAG: (2Fe-2S)-binding protein [Gammaproteobacteria bacterium]|nr:(2Fe-2S)-binding protein [Gammaproteobacteria bacterium]
MSGFVYWCDRRVPFRPGESLAYTLLRETAAGYGTSVIGQTYGLFCGIGACQGCLVEVEGRGVVEACLTFPDDGMRVNPVHSGSDHGSAATVLCDDE